MQTAEEKSIFIFIGYMDEPLLALNELRKVRDRFGQKNIFVVSINYFTEELKKATGVQINYLEEFLEKEDYEYMENYAARTSNSWHKALPYKKNITEFKSVDLMKILRLDTYTFLCTAIKNLHVIFNVIDKKKPSRVFLIEEKKEDRLEGIARILNQELGMKTVYVKLRSFNIKRRIYELPGDIKALISGIAVGLLDSIERLYIKKRRIYKNSIVIDYRLPRAIRGLEKKYITVSYVIEKGLRLRLGFLKTKIPYFCFRNATKIRQNRIEKKYFHSIRTRLKSGFDAENLRYKGYFIYDVLKSIFKANIEKDVPVARDYVSNIYAFFESIKPKIVIVRDSVRKEEMALVSAAKCLNIPSLVIQHGIEILKTVYAEQSADSIALWGGAYREWYASAGVDVLKSEVTGYHLHDHIHSEKEGRQKRYEDTLKRIGADPKKTTIVYLANCITYYPLMVSVHGVPDLSFVALKATLDAFKEFKDVQLVIKLHPYYEREKYSKFEKEISNFSNVFVLKNADIPDLFSGSVAVISELFSSALMDAIILKKPVIFYNFSKKEGLHPFEKRGVGFEINSPGDLKRIIEYIVNRHPEKGGLKDEDFESFARDYAYKIDGRSSERVRNLIDTLVTK